MNDLTELFGNSLIQHGEKNNRVYLMKLSKENFPEILGYMDNLAINNGYTKIIAKVQTDFKEVFLKNGYEFEASIKNFYNGKQDVYFLSKYFSDERKFFNDKEKITSIKNFCLEKRTAYNPQELNKKYEIKKLKEKHIPELINLYKNVFESYPFPIFENDYILKTMSTNIDYFGVFEGNKLLATASSEMDLEKSNTELTDFATLPKYRGNNFSLYLLKHMETIAEKKGIKTLYTIARAKLASINIIFSKLFYIYGGTLIKNTNICGDIESMNIWYKNL